MTAWRFPVPAPAVGIAAAHLAWGLFLFFGYAWLGAEAEQVKPLFVAAWFGTTAMLMVFGLVVASEGWRRNETWYLSSLLIFDLAALVLLIEVLRVS